MSAVSCPRCLQPFKSPAGLRRHEGRKVPCVAPAGAAPLAAPVTAEPLTQAAPSGVACPRCAQVLKNAAGLARHLARKNPCAAAPGAAPAQAVPEEPPAEGSDLKRVVWGARNLMRAAGVTGMEALDCLVTLFALREIERLFPRIADASTFELGEWPDHNVEYTVKRGFVLFSKLASWPFDDGEGLDWGRMVRSALGALRYHPDARASRPLWEDVQKNYPLSHSRVSYDLIRYVRDRIPFDGPADTIGETYMSTVRDFVDGKELGQFFTPKGVVACLVDRLTTGGRALGRVFDPTCGSGGFLAAAIRAGAASANGVEIDVRVRLLAYFNTLLAGAKAPDIVRADFLRGPVAGAPFDSILANPPFGIKGIRFEELLAPQVNANGAEIFPLKTTSTGFFLSRILHCLKVGGRAAVILPLGREIASRAAGDVKFRRALLKAAKILEVIEIPSDTFSNTSIRTVALVFEKVAELGAGLTKKGIREEVSDATPSLQFLRLAIDDKIQPHGWLLAPAHSATAEEIQARGCSLSPDDYTSDQAAPPLDTSCVVPKVRLGDLFTIKKGSVNVAEIVPGQFFTYTSAATPIPSAAFDNEGAALVLPGMGTLRAWAVDGCYGVGRECFTMKPVGPLDLKYVAHFVNMNRSELNKARAGLTRARLNTEAAKSLEIPLPPLEVQRELAARLDELDALAKAAVRAAAQARADMRTTLHRALGSKCAPGSPAPPSDDSGEGAEGEIETAAAATSEESE